MHQRLSQLIRVGLICLTMVSVWACDSLLGSEDSSNGGGGGSELAFLNIVGAEALFIAPGSGSQSSVSSSVTDVATDTLFKITEDGFVQEVTFLDEENNEIIVTNTPTEIYDVNSAYVIVLFDFDGYLVRKSDGAVFSLDGVGVPAGEAAQINTFLNAPVIQTDGVGNLYYQVISDSPGFVVLDVQRINVGDPARLSAETYVTVPNAGVDSFFVTPNAHVVYRYNNSVNSVRGNRIQKATGGFENLSDDPLFFWIGNDGNIKYHLTDSTASMSNVFTVTIDANGTSSQTSVSGVDLLNSFQSYLFRFSTRTVAVDIFNDRIYELENADDTPRDVTTTPNIAGFNFDYAVASTDYYYIAGDNDTNQPVFVRVDPTDDSVSDILPVGEYDVFRAVVTADGTITFNAQRTNDGAIVVGEISPVGNEVTILSADLNDEVVELIRVN